MCLSCGCLHLLLHIGIVILHGGSIFVDVRQLQIISLEYCDRVFMQ